MKYCFLFFVLICGPVFGAEKDYQLAWCQGEVEHVLPDRTRIDCLTEDYAIEFDFAKKWAEAIGQALYYASQTQKQAGIVIIVEDQERDEKYLKRLYAALYEGKLDVEVWQVGPKVLE